MASLCAGTDVLLVAAACCPGQPPQLGAAGPATMKSSALLVNVVRGPLIDQPALLAPLAGATLDIFYPEPPYDDDALFALENFVVAPYVPGPSPYSVLGLARSSLVQVLPVRAGRRMSSTPKSKTAADCGATWSPPSSDM